jgi:hypothetical protein
VTDLRDLLDTVAGAPGVPTPDIVEGDVRRGRRALLRRRSVRGGAGALAAVALALGVTILPGVVGGDPQTVSVASRPGPEAVPLVPAEQQDKGLPYSSALVPQGWTPAVDAFVLTYSPPGVTTGLDDFQRKLIVCLTPDVTPGAGVREVSVGGSPGSLWTEHGTTILVWRLGDGRKADVQAPKALHWDTPTLVRFAESVAFGPGAQASRG